MTHDYGRADRGFSYEYYNFLPALRRMPIEVQHFDFVAAVSQFGYWAAGTQLMSLVERWEPDVLLCFMYQEQLSRDVIRWISAKTPTVTIAWFSDDHWRFPDFSRHWAPAFNWVLTTDASAVGRYQTSGHPGVLRTQWAFNELTYKPTGGPLLYDVSFVGEAYGGRRATIQRLAHHGINVRAWGRGWPAGRLSQSEMIEVFAASRVNLNLSASSRFSRLSRTRRLRPQVKGRVFEVTGCGGLLLTDMAPGLDECFLLGQEIVVFRDTNQLVRRVRRLLSNEDERSEIAQAGHRRVLRDHTYQSRLAAIFRGVGLFPAP